MVQEGTEQFSFSFFYHRKKNVITLSYRKRWLASKKRGKFLTNETHE